jgi:hypothetical protein
MNVYMLVLVMMGGTAVSQHNTAVLLWVRVSGPQTTPILRT